jgi:ABC-type cobalamin/Fe3+-siderophores transport system ATPase subunit
VIELKNGRIEAGGQVVIDDLSFVAPAGKVTCLTGVHGCGKTLLVRTLLGLWPLQRGYVSLKGEPVTLRSAKWLRRLMTYVPQQLPQPFTDALEVLDDQEPTPDKCCIIVDDPFCGMDDERAVLLTNRLQTLAEAGKTVVVTCSPFDAVRFTPSVTLAYQIST